MPNIYKSDAGQRRVEESYRALLAMWPVPSQHIVVPTRQGDTFVVASGPEDAPPLVLLHGSTANATSWMGEIADYAKHFRCYCVDMIGEPGLSAPSRPDFRTDAYVLWMSDVLDGLKCARAAFVVISLGGLVAFQFGAAHPERVVALAGNAPAGLCRGKHFILSHLPYFFMGEWGKRRIFEAIMGKVAPDTSPMGQQFAAFFALTASAFRPRMLNLPTLSDTEVRNLHFPILTVLGGRDVMLHTEQTRDRLTALAPDASIDFRPDAHHYIQGTQEVILPFLREVHGL